MSHAFAFDTGLRTHQGCVRDHNEDNCLALPESGLWLVADGMGGHAAGDVASSFIAQDAATLGRPASAADLQARFLDRLLLAHQRIRLHGESLGAVIGSTVAALLIYEAHFACIWAGDSRIYLLRAGQLRQLTVDHTEVQALLAQGMLSQEEARTWPRRNVITRAIGVFDLPDTDQLQGEIQAGDTFLICSDGLTEHVEPEEIRGILARFPVQESCERLVDLTLSRGARDNVTAVCIRCRLVTSEPADRVLEGQTTLPGLAPLPLQPLGQASGRG